MHTAVCTMKKGGACGYYLRVDVEQCESKE